MPGWTPEQLKAIQDRQNEARAEPKPVTPRPASKKVPATVNPGVGPGLKNDFELHPLAGPYPEDMPDWSRPAGEEGDNASSAAAVEAAIPPLLRRPEPLASTPPAQVPDQAGFKLPDWRAKMEEEYAKAPTVAARNAASLAQVDNLQSAAIPWSAMATALDKAISDGLATGSFTSGAPPIPGATVPPTPETDRAAGLPPAGAVNVADIYPGFRPTSAAGISRGPFALLTAAGLNPLSSEDQEKARAAITERVISDWAARYNTTPEALEMEAHLRGIPWAAAVEKAKRGAGLMEGGAIGNEAPASRVLEEASRRGANLTSRERLPIPSGMDIDDKLFSPNFTQTSDAGIFYDPDEDDQVVRPGEKGHDTAMALLDALEQDGIDASWLSSVKKTADPFQSYMDRRVPDLMREIAPGAVPGQKGFDAAQARAKARALAELTALRTVGLWTQPIFLRGLTDADYRNMGITPPDASSPMVDAAMTTALPITQLSDVSEAILPDVEIVGFGPSPDPNHPNLVLRQRSTAATVFDALDLPLYAGTALVENISENERRKAEAAKKGVAPDLISPVDAVIQGVYTRRDPVTALMESDFSKPRPVYDTNGNLLRNEDGTPRTEENWRPYVGATIGILASFASPDTLTGVGALANATSVARKLSKGLRSIDEATAAYKSLNAIAEARTNGQQLLRAAHAAEDAGDVAEAARLRALSMEEFKRASEVEGRAFSESEPLLRNLDIADADVARTMEQAAPGINDPHLLADLDVPDPSGQGSLSNALLNMHPSVRQERLNVKAGRLEQQVANRVRLYSTDDALARLDAAFEKVNADAAVKTRVDGAAAYRMAGPYLARLETLAQGDKATLDALTSAREKLRRLDFRGFILDVQNARGLAPNLSAAGAATPAERAARARLRQQFPLEAAAATRFAMQNLPSASGGLKQLRRAAEEAILANSESRAIAAGILTDGLKDKVNPNIGVREAGDPTLLLQGRLKDVAPRLSRRAKELLGEAVSTVDISAAKSAEEVEAIRKKAYDSYYPVVAAMDQRARTAAWTRRTTVEEEWARLEKLQADPGGAELAAAQGRGAEVLYNREPRPSFMPTSPELQEKLASARTAREAALAIAAHADDPYQRLIADTLAQHLPADVTFNVSRTSGIGGEFRLAQVQQFKDEAGLTRGAYRAGRVTVESTKDARLVLHELTHAATAQVIERVLKRGPTTDEAATAVASLQYTFDAAKDALTRRGDAAALTRYGFKDVHEFVAEAFSNPEFQQVLRGIPSPDTTAISLWDRFVSGVRKVLGISENVPPTLFDEVMNAAPSVMRENLGVVDDLKLRGAAKKAGDGYDYIGEVEDGVLYQDILALRDVSKLAVPEGFFSPLQRALDVVLKKGGEGGVRASVLLKEARKQPGVKADELEWSGIARWLESQGEAKVTRRQVAEEIAKREPVVEVVGVKSADTSPEMRRLGVAIQTGVEKMSVLAKEQDAALTALRESARPKVAAMIQHLLEMDPSLKVSERLVGRFLPADEYGGLSDMYLFDSILGSESHPGWEVVEAANGAVKSSPEAEAYRRVVADRREVSQQLNRDQEEMRRIKSETNTVFDGYVAPGPSENYREIRFLQQDPELLQKKQQFSVARQEAEDALGRAQDRLRVIVGNAPLNRAGALSYDALLKHDMKPLPDYDWSVLADQLDASRRSAFDAALRDIDSAKKRVHQLDTTEGPKNPGPGSAVRQHFEPNTIAHLRTTDRVGPNGEKILFVEEVQSDWHQAGAKSQYLPRDAKSRFDALQAEIGSDTWTDIADDSRYEAMKEVESRPERAGGWNKIAEAIAIENSGVGGSTPEIRKFRAMLAESAALDKALRMGSVNPGTHSELWRELALKQALSIAAREGYDGVALTRGEIIQDVVGGEKEGQLVFYNTMLPKTLEKVAGEKAGRINLSLRSAAEPDTELIEAIKYRDQVRGRYNNSKSFDPPDAPHSATMRLKAQLDYAEKEVAQLEAKRSLPYLPISPALRERVVGEGLALYSEDAAKARTSTPTAAEQELAELKQRVAETPALGMALNDDIRRLTTQVAAEKRAAKKAAGAEKVPAEKVPAEKKPKTQPVEKGATATPPAPTPPTPAPPDVAALKSRLPDLNEKIAEADATLERLRKRQDRIDASGSKFEAQVAKLAAEMDRVAAAKRDYVGQRQRLLSAIRRAEKAAVDADVGKVKAAVDAAVEAADTTPPNLDLLRFSNAKAAEALAKLNADIGRMELDLAELRKTAKTNTADTEAFNALSARLEQAKKERKAAVAVARTTEMELKRGIALDEKLRAAAAEAEVEEAATPAATPTAPTQRQMLPDVEDEGSLNSPGDAPLRGLTEPRLAGLSQGEVGAATAPTPDPDATSVLSAEEKARLQQAAQLNASLGQTPAAAPTRNPLYNDALRFAVNEGRVSASMLQRRFGIGYVQASRIIDEMEAAGAISGAGATPGPRTVLASAPASAVPPTPPVSTSTSPPVSPAAAPPTPPTPPTPTPPATSPRGTLPLIIENGKIVLDALASPDTETLLHAVGHVLRQGLDEDEVAELNRWLSSSGPSASSTPSPAQLDPATGKWVGSASDVQAAEDAFTSAFREYLVSGSPPPGLNASFADMKGSLSALLGAAPSGTLPPDTQRLFDRLMGFVPSQEAKDAAKAAAKDPQATRPSFLSRYFTGPPASAGPEVYTELAKAAQSAGLDVTPDSLKKMLADKGRIEFPVPVLGRVEYTAENLADTQKKLWTEWSASRDEATQRLPVTDFTQSHPNRWLTDKIDSALVEGESDSARMKRAKQFGRLVSATLIGMDAQPDLKKFAAAVRPSLLVGQRRVETAYADAVKLVSERDPAKMRDYLLGKRVTSKHGAPFASSGTSKAGPVRDILSGVIDDMGDSARAGIDILKRDPDIDTLSEDDRKRVAAAVEALLYNPSSPRFSKDLAAVLNLPQLAPGSGVINGLPDVAPYVGALARFATDVDEDAALTSLIEGTRRLQGDEAAARVQVLLAGHGEAASARSVWRELGIAISRTDAVLFKRWVMGERIPEGKLDDIRRIARRFGTDAEFVEDSLAAGNRAEFIPDEVNKRMVNALSKKTQDKPHILMSPEDIRDRGTFVAEVLGAYATALKVARTRGLFTLRAWKVFADSIDHIYQMAQVNGLGTALATSARILPQTMLATFPLLPRMVYHAEGRLLRPGTLERVRQYIQMGGDKAAQVVSKVMGRSALRLDVNQILKGDNTPVTIGNTVFRPGDILRIATEEGIFSSFPRDLDNVFRRAATDAASTWGKLGAVPHEAEQFVDEMAEAWATRERLGAMVTLMEMGIDPRTAARLTVDALFDYGASVANAERSLLMSIFFPFWAFEKNARRLQVNALFSPELLYRMVALHRFQEYGPNALTEAIYNSATDPYGIDPSQLPPEARENYYAIRSEVESRYGRDPKTGLVDFAKVPPKVRDALSAILRGVGGWDLRRGRLYETPASTSELVEGARGDARFEMTSGDKATLGTSSATQPRPDASARATFRRDVGGIALTPKLTKQLDTYYKLMRAQYGNVPYLEVYAPETTIETGIRGVGATLATYGMALGLVLDSAAKAISPDEVDPAAPLSSWETSPASRLAQPLRQVFDPDRSFMLPEIADWLTDSELAAPARISKTTYDLLQQAGFHPIAARGVKDPFAPATGSEATPVYPDPRAETQNYQDQPESLKGDRYYMPPGLPSVLWEMSGFRALDQELLLNPNPLLTPGLAAEAQSGLERAMDRPGEADIADVIQWLKYVLHIPVDEVNRSETARREAPKFKSETLTPRTPQ